MFVFSPNCVAFVPRGHALFTESSFLFLTWVSVWLQAKEPVRPVAVGVARGPQWDLWLASDTWPSKWLVPVSGTCGRQWDLRLSAWLSYQWDPWLMVWLPLWLTVWPMAIVGPVAVGVAHGWRWGLWLEVGPQCSAWPWLLLWPRSPG